MYTDWFQPIDTPPTVFTNDLLASMFDSVRYSMRSSATVGLLSFGAVISVIIIIRIFSEKYLQAAKITDAVNRRKFNRQVDTEDFSRNANDIVENQILKRTISHYVNGVWRSRFRAWDVADAVYRKEVNLDASIEFMEKNRDLILQERVEARRINKGVREEHKLQQSEAYRASATDYYKRRRKKMR